MKQTSQPPVILVIEDDPDISESLAEVLGGEGYRVVTAGNGKEGLERLEQIGQPSLILLDLMMPVMSGSEFLEVLRQSSRWARTPVVLVSAWPGEATHLADVQAFVEKPVALEQLLAVAHQYCDQSMTTELPR